LKELNPVFGFLPVETIIKEKQLTYYKSLEKSDKLGNSTPFIEFMLGTINRALEEQLNERRPSISAVDRINIFRDQVGKEEFSRKDYLNFFKDISAPTASRDLKMAVINKSIKRKGEKSTTVYYFINKKV
jgi:Fic family protein